jgi:hypothetical protein
MRKKQYDGIVVGCGPGGAIAGKFAALTSTTTIMAGFTIMVEARTVLVITLRKRSEDITTSATANITNSIIAIILTNGTNIPGTASNPQDRKIGGNET